MNIHLKVWNVILKSLGFLPSISMALLLLLSSAPQALAQQAAKLYSVEGVVEGKIAPSAQWEAVAKDAVFKQGDALRTGDASRAAIVGSDGLMVRLSANALLEFNQAVDGKAAEMGVGKGDAYFLSRDPHSAPRVTTSIVSGSIRGTEFTVSVRPEGVIFSVFDGAVDVSNPLGSVALAVGEEALTEPGKAPQKRLMVNPTDAVQWALRYPALISISEFITWIQAGTLQEKRGAQFLLEGNMLAAKSEFQGTSARSILGQALTELSSADPSSTAKLFSMTKDSKDPGIAVLKSALALEAGQVDVAKQYQQSAKRGLEGNQTAEAQALLRLVRSQEAVLAVVRNERDAAEKTADEILVSSPESREALFVKSLVLQSRGDIDGALNTIRSALSKEPKNPALLSRAAELTFGTGDAKEAERLALSALEVNATDADARTMLGFIELGRGKVAEGEKSFEQAISSNAQNSSAYLGLGIAKFHSGDKVAGRIEIQKAVHLDPQVALYRSYLGKAFFENEEEGKAAEELAMAAKLDPLDPTPHLYMAFNHLATYRPVAALGSLEDSIERNDNRAVYRSRLLLDKDQATRGSGLGRVFSALDFIVPMQIEALKSLSEDPTNYEAHFLLKDSLIGPETNAAFVSEDVVATLLAPANFSSLIPTASGAATLNEYSTLFEQPQSRTGVDVIAQSEDKVLETSEVHYAGGADYSYLLRHGMTYAHGYRDNDYDRFQTGRFLGQYAVTPEDKILVEAIVNDRELGDTSIGLDPNSNDPDLEFSFDDFTGRLGFRHTFSEQSQLIAQSLFINSKLKSHDLSQERQFGLDFIEENGDISQFIDGGIFESDSRVRTKGVRGDLQHLWNSEYLSLVQGFSVVGFEDTQSASNFTLADDLAIFESLDITSEASNDVHAYRGYSYATVKPYDSFRLVGGLNYTDLASSARGTEPFVERESNRNDLSPKVGVIVYPSSSFTIRSSYIETLGSSSSRELEGIEPGQVAGIGQLYDDGVGTEAHITGVGIDWKDPKSTYLGVSLINRDLNQPNSFTSDLLTIDIDGNVISSIPEEQFEAHSHEQSIAGYVNQILTESLVGSLNYDWTESDNDFDNFQVRTHRVRLGVNYFHDSGFFAFGSGTFRSQEREGFDAADVSASEDFLILSSGLGWQLPHRQGSVQLSIRNMLDEDFRYAPVASDIRFYPGTDVALSVNYNF